MPQRRAPLERTQWRRAGGWLPRQRTEVMPDGPGRKAQGRTEPLDAAGLDSRVRTGATAPGWLGAGREDEQSLPSPARRRMARSTGLSATSQTARRQPAGWHRKDTIPPKVRRLVSARDPWCLRCGSPRDLEQHHRRLKQAGGDPRPHTDCCCNLIRLCTGCHAWVHGHRAGAEASGWRLPAETVLPASDGVMRNSDDGGVTSWPSCGGKWLDEPCEVAA